MLLVERLLLICRLAATCERALLRDERKTVRSDVGRRARIRIDARVRQLQAVVDNSLVVQQLTTHDPVATVETREVGAAMAELQVRVHVAKHEPIADRRADHQVLNGRVDGELPLLDPERVGIVGEAGILDEVLKVRVTGSAPGLQTSDFDQKAADRDIRCTWKRKSHHEDQHPDQPGQGRWYRSVDCC